MFFNDELFNMIYVLIAEILKKREFSLDFL